MSDTLGNGWAFLPGGWMSLTDSYEINLHC